MGYSQNDPQWAGLLLGAGPDRIGPDGCYLTTDAMVATWAGHPINPQQLNELYVTNGVYVEGELLRDTALHEAFPDLFALDPTYDCSGVPCDQNQLNNDDPNLYVIVEITNGGSLTHFMPIVQWRDWSADNPWPWADAVESVGAAGLRFGWGSDPTRLIVKAVKVRYIGGNTPAPAGSWTGVVDADGGAHVHTLPGTDQPIVPQPGPGDTTVVDKGVTLTFDAWCQHPPAIADAITGQPDDRWFRTTSGHWIASAVVKGNPPAGLAAIPDPSPAPAPSPQPQPTPSPAGDPGIDVSEYQQAIDWDAVAKDAEVKWVMIRSSFGCPSPGESATAYIDKTFFHNWAEARRIGLPRIAYHFAYPSYNSPEAEAEFFLQQIATQLLAGDGVMLDLEEDGMKKGPVVGAPDLDTWTAVWLGKVAAGLNGYQAIWYSNDSFIKDQKLGPQLTGYPLALAGWSGPQPVPPVGCRLVIWQWTDASSESGIPGKVDADVFLGTPADLALLMWKGRPAPTPPPLPPPPPIPSNFFQAFLNWLISLLRGYQR